MPHVLVCVCMHVCSCTSLLMGVCVGLQVRREPVQQVSCYAWCKSVTQVLRCAWCKSVTQVLCYAWCKSVTQVLCYAWCKSVTQVLCYAWCKSVTQVLCCAWRKQGLEFNTIFLAGFEDGLCPLERGGDDGSRLPTDFQEEKRLAYVSAAGAGGECAAACTQWAQAELLGMRKCEVGRSRQVPMSIAERSSYPVAGPNEKQAGPHVRVQSTSVR